MRFAFAGLLLLFPLLLSGQVDDPGKLKRAQEIESWSSAIGTWEGRYFLEAAPDELLHRLDESGTRKTGIGIRVILRDDSASVFLQYEPNGEWAPVGAESHVIPDKIAWHILMGNEGGVWLERYFLSFMRIEEDVANFVITRTVHNWYDTGAPEARNTYYVFGAGKVTRTKVTK